MVQKDLFGEYVDTLEERTKAQVLADEYCDLIDEMKIDFESGKYNPFIEKLERNLHPVDFLNMYWFSSRTFLFCKNTEQVRDCFKDKIDYNEIITDYKKWKEEKQDEKIKGKN